MDEMTISEVITFHMELRDYKTIDELINRVTSNLEELAKKEIAMRVGATCLYSSFSEACDFCGQCIREEFDTCILFIIGLLVSVYTCLPS